MKTKSHIPLFMLTDMNAYGATGKMINHYPYAKRISLDGGKRLTYRMAHRKIRECLDNNENKEICEMESADKIKIIEVHEFDEFLNLRLDLGGVEVWFTIDKENREWGFSGDDSWETTKEAAKLLNVNPDNFWDIMNPILDSAIATKSK